MYLEYLLMALGFAFHLMCASLIIPFASRRSASYQRLDFPLRKAWCMRWTSTIHAVVSTAFGLAITIAVTLIYGLEDYVLWHGVIGRISLSWSIGYMVHDFVWMLIFRKQVQADMPGYIHHFLVILAFYLCLSFKVFLYYANFRLISEFSTPFVNFRWMLSKTGRKETTLYLYNGYMMTGTFFVFRVLLIPLFWTSAVLVMQTQSYAEGITTFESAAWLFLCVSMDLLNLMWMYKIVRGIVAFRSPNHNESNVINSRANGNVHGGSDDDGTLIIRNESFSPTPLT